MRNSRFLCVEEKHINELLVTIKSDWFSDHSSQVNVLFGFHIESQDSFDPKVLLKISGDEYLYVVRDNIADSAWDLEDSVESCTFCSDSNVQPRIEMIGFEETTLDQELSESLHISTESIETTYETVYGITAAVCEPCAETLAQVYTFLTQDHASEIVSWNI